MTEDEMVEWHYRLKRHEFEQTLRLGEQGKPGVLQSMGSPKVGHSWATEQQHLGSLIPKSEYLLSVLPI